jgi:hypothetical protein
MIIVDHEYMVDIDYRVQLLPGYRNYNAVQTLKNKVRNVPRIGPDECRALEVQIQQVSCLQQTSKCFVVVVWYHRCRFNNGCWISS